MASTAMVAKGLSQQANSLQAFLEILFHDDRNSNYIYARRTGGVWMEAVLTAESFASFSPDSAADCYITRNGFNGRRRTADRTRQVNALMYDIDCHGGDHEQVVPLVVSALADAQACGVLPHPNLLVATGRGVQVYYVLDRSTPYRVKGGRVNERGLAFFKDVEAGLARTLARVVAPIEGTTLDASVYDLARVGRLPGTWNSAAGAPCRLLEASREYHDLISLKTYCTKAEATAPRARGHVIKFDRLLISRIAKIEQLQQLRGYDCSGSREQMCFVYYNSAKQVYGPARAKSMTEALNAKFAQPLPARDIDQVQRSVDSAVVQFGRHKGEHGFYPLSAQTVAEKLALTSDEIEATGFFSSKRLDERMAAKRATAQRRAARDAHICRLYGNGLTQAQVAERVGVSLRTVATVIAREGVKRGELMKPEAEVRAAFEQVKAAKIGHAKKWQTSCCGIGQGLEERDEVSFVCGIVRYTTEGSSLRHSPPLLSG